MHARQDADRRRDVLEQAAELGEVGAGLQIALGVHVQVEADALVFATTSMAQDHLASELEKRSIPYAAIGDCTASRQAAFAIHDGRKVALSL